ncbi:MAG: Csp1 family four helix bundle copper storage protein [Myxococcales bacterium]|nr:Csp1 family four helix bundle copper storage protein [Myxococcales bacterium]
MTVVFRYFEAMKRRDVMMVGAATAVAQTMMAATGCKAEGGTTAAAAASASSGPSDLADALGACIGAGETCMTHCLRLLSKGDTSLGACAVSVREMLAVCRAVETLARSSSAHLAAAASLCASVCESCRVECAKHSSHHPECAACEQACVRTVAAARAVAGA